MASATFGKHQACLACLLSAHGTGSYMCRHDAWSRLRPGEPGLTYDKATNPMLGVRMMKWGKRIDRVLCKLSSLRLQGIQMVGMKRITGAVRYKQERNQNIVELPVLPSDHYGLFVELAPIAA